MSPNVVLYCRVMCRVVLHRVDTEERLTHPRGLSYCVVSHCVATLCYHFVLYSCLLFCVLVLYVVVLYGCVVPCRSALHWCMGGEE